MRQLARRHHPQVGQTRAHGIDQSACMPRQARTPCVAQMPLQIPHPSSGAGDARCYTARMFTAASLSGDKPQQYAQLAQQARALLHGEHDRIANAANLSALVFNTLPGVNWAGFYFFDGTELVVGPFQGLPACVRIPLDKGVCGAAASSRQTQRIDDVDAFPGHIACDSASRSELVIPLLQGDTLVGVFDIDSPEPARFDVEDQEGLEAIARIWVESLS